MGFKLKYGAKKLHLVWYLVGMYIFCVFYFLRKIYRCTSTYKFSLFSTFFLITISLCADVFK